MTPTLDRSRDYGTVHGDHEHGAHTVQDGFFFDAQDNLIEGAMDEVQVARLAELRNQDAAIEQARAKFLELMPNADKATVDKLINVANLKPADPNAEEVDLAAWANGTKTYVFGRVTKRIRELYNISPANRLQCLEVLAENGVIAPRSQTPTSPSL
jgi:hypothetical protein